MAIKAYEAPATLESLGQKHPVRLTALLYLKESLAAEAYEDCAMCIEIAKEFGATGDDVHFILEDPRRTPA